VTRGWPGREQGSSASSPWVAPGRHAANREEEEEAPVVLATDVADGAGKKTEISRANHPCARREGEWEGRRRVMSLSAASPVWERWAAWVRVAHPRR
jgi:hypothetical protein